MLSRSSGRRRSRWRCRSRSSSAGSCSPRFRATGIAGVSAGPTRRSVLPRTSTSPRRELRVAHFSRPRDDLARRSARRSRCRDCARSSSVSRGRVRRIERDLHDARAVAQIDEHEAAEVAPAMDPAAEADVRADVLEPKRAAERVAKGRLEGRALTHEARAPGDARRLECERRSSSDADCSRSSRTRERSPGATHATARG